MIEVLKSFGFTEYEAKALVALIAKGSLTAREIAEFSGIPRTSVYDVMESLKAKGFVEEFGKPAKFRAVSTEEIIATLSKRMSENLEVLKEEIAKLRSGEEVELVKLYRGKSVFEKLEELVISAKDEIVILISYLKPEIKEILSKARCKLVVISSNASELAGECYEIKSPVVKNRTDFAHGLAIFDSEKIFAIFVNNVTIGIAGEGEGLVQFSKLMIEPLLRELRRERLKIEKQP
ncbi:MAG: helix-turn-helix domain-containing protein [Archaeoglobaceae archaeon]